MKQLIPIILLASTVLTGCSSRAESGDSAEVAAYVSPNASTPAPASGGSSRTCFTADDVKSALGFDARSLTGGMRQYGTMWNCGYAAADDAKLPGVTVSATVSPAAEADSTFDHMKQVVKMSKGGNAQPDVLPVGERGLAYGTSSQARASAVANGQLYSVEVGFGGVANFGDKKDGAIELLRKLMGS